jgi:hypothetical protein
MARARRGRIKRGEIVGGWVGSCAMVAAGWDYFEKKNKFKVCMVFKRFKFVCFLGIFFCMKLPLSPIYENTCFNKK